jgi:5,10-methylenetetrahydrofolate reductase
MSPKKFETNTIRQQLNRTPYGEHSSPLFLTSSFVFEDAEHMRASFAEENDQNLYSRFSNPNTTEFIDKVVTMEGAQAGADYVVTQMFFDNQRYFKFVTMAREMGITIPIIPGIKPLAIQKHLKLLPQVFKIDLPEALIKEVNGCNSNAQIRQVGVEWAIQQSKELLDFAVPVLHYYSMGKSDNIKAIASQLF